MNDSSRAGRDLPDRRTEPQKTAEQDLRPSIDRRSRNRENSSDGTSTVLAAAESLSSLSSGRWASRRIDGSLLLKQESNPESDQIRFVAHERDRSSVELNSSGKFSSDYQCFTFSINGEIEVLVCNHDDSPIPFCPRFSVQPKFQSNLQRSPIQGGLYPTTPSVAVVFQSSSQESHASWSRCYEAESCFRMPLQDLGSIPQQHSMDSTTSLAETWTASSQHQTDASMIAHSPKMLLSPYGRQSEPLREPSFASSSRSSQTSKRLRTIEEDTVVDLSRKKQRSAKPKSSVAQLDSRSSFIAKDSAASSSGKNPTSCLVHSGKSEAQVQVSSRRLSIEETIAKIQEKKESKRKGTKKDPNAPKNPRSSYVYFLMEERAKMTGPRQKSFNEEALELAQVWKLMTPAQKLPYVQMHLRDKRRYQIEKREYSEKMQQANRQSCSVQHHPEKVLNAMGERACDPTEPCLELHFSEEEDAAASAEEGDDDYIDHDD